MRQQRIWVKSPVIDAVLTCLVAECTSGEEHSQDCTLRQEPHDRSGLCLRSVSIEHWARTELSPTRLLCPVSSRAVFNHERVEALVRYELKLLAVLAVDSSPGSLPHMLSGFSGSTCRQTWSTRSTTWCADQPLSRLKLVHKAETIPLHAERSSWPRP